MPNTQPKQTEDTLKEWAIRIRAIDTTDEMALEMVKKIHIDAYTLGRIRKIEQEQPKPQDAHEHKEDLNGDCYTCGKDMLKPQDTQEKCLCKRGDGVLAVKEPASHSQTECKPQDTESWEEDFDKKFTYINELGERKFSIIRVEDYTLSHPI